MVLGHESAGIISKVGSKVTDRHVGQVVSMEPGQVCRVCDYCKDGRYQLCKQCLFAATYPKDGTLGRYYKIPAELTYPIPDTMSMEEGAMIEPLSVAVHALYNIAKLRANQTVAIFGAGPIGLVSMAVAKACAAKRIIVVDIKQDRLDFAKSFAGVDTFRPPPPKEGEARMDYSERATQALMAELKVDERGPNGVDVILDASGAEVCIQMAVFLAKPGAVMVQVGMGTPNVQLPLTVLLVKELQLRGSFRYGAGAYSTAISLVAQGRIDLKPLITHRYTFDQTAEAFETVKAGHSADGKPVIKAIISGPE
jgi:D-xylulose reductase